MPSKSSESPPSSTRSADKKGPPEIRIRVSWCKGCGLCVDYCNRDVLVMEGVLPKVVQAERCTRCLLCEAICPDFAIEIGDEEAAARSEHGGGESSVTNAELGEPRTQRESRLQQADARPDAVAGIDGRVPSGGRP